MSVLADIHRCEQRSAELFAAALSPGVSLTNAQYRVLDAVLQAKGKPSQTGVVEVTRIDRSTLADIVRRLVSRRLLVRKRNKADARAYELDLTDEGRKAHQAGKIATEQAESALLDCLSIANRAALRNLLASVARD